MGRLSEELVTLREIVGEGALRSLRRSQHTVLHIWRRTTPHNWWVENLRGDMLWHSGEGRWRPDIRMFDLVEHSAETVTYPVYPGLFGASDHGSPEMSTYRLKRQHRLRKMPP